ncbi:uncharacterized protein Hap1MRO34_018217 [Clarias gariepinus]
MKWKSNSIVNLFDDPSVELSAVSSADKSASGKQKLLCYGTGLNPEIKWLPESVGNSDNKVTMNADGRVKVSSELSVTEQEWKRGTNFTCQVRDQSLTKNIPKTINICEGYPNSALRIQLEKPPLKSILTDKQITLSCVIETVFHPTVSWLVDGNKKSDSDSNSKRQDESTVSNLTISVEDWTKSGTITCRAEHPCFQTIQDFIKTTETVQKTPTVVIRRSLADVGKSDSAVLECFASSLPSGELSVTFQANDKKFPQIQFVNLLKEQDTVTAHFTIPKTHRTNNTRFTCQIQKSHSMKWKSNSIVNLFDDPSVELSAVSSADKSASGKQKLLCYGTGLNPEIKWLPESVGNPDNEVTMNADGRVKVSSELSVTEQEWKRGTNFTCQVNDQSRQKTVQKLTSFCAVTSDHARSAQVYLIGPSMSDMPEEDPVSVICLLLGHGLQDFSVSCKVGTANVSANVNKTENHLNGTESVQRVISVPAKMWKNYENVSCEVKHPCSNAQTYITSKTKAMIVTPPSISISTSINTTTNDIILICWLDNFHTKVININWEAGKKGTSKKFNNEGNNEFSMLSQISINAQQWNEGKEFTCSATHKDKTYNQTWSICKGHPNSEPRIHLEKPPLRSILTDKQVTVSCVVETVFHPKVSWLVDGNKKSDRDSNSKRQDESTVSNLTISVEDWTKSGTITCRAEHPCFQTIQDFIKTTETVQKTPTVVIRRSLADVGKSDSAVLECFASSLPSGELSITFQANDEKFPQIQFVNLLKEQDTVTAHFTIPTTHRTKNYRFTCQIQKSHSMKWKSNSIVNLFDDPSVELSAVSSADKSASGKQKLLCYGTGLNPEIKWLPESVGNSDNEVTMNADGRVKVSSELSVTEQEWKRGTIFTCQVRDQSLTKNIPKTINICEGHPNSALRIHLEKPPLKSILTDKQITLSCVIETVFHPTVSWLVDGNKKSDSDSNSKRQDESTVSNLTISVEDWTKSRTITCRAEHPCFQTIEDFINTTETVQKTPTVVIRRSLADVGKSDSAVLECFASSLPSGELSVTFQANDEKFPQIQFVNLLKEQDTVTAHFTIPTTHRTKNYRFTCQIQKSHSMKWKSNSIVNLFDDPSVELSAVSSADKSASRKQKLLCYGTGLNPAIKWLPESVGNSDNEVTMNADGRVKVSSELSVTEQEWKRGTTFTCQVRDQSLTKNIPKTINICEGHPNSALRIQLEKPSLKSILTDKQITLSCVIETVFHPTVSWLVDGNKKSGSDSNSKRQDESTVSNLTISVEDWTKSGTITCRAEHPCFQTIEDFINTTATVQKTPTVVIRRSLADVGKSDSAVLECFASSLPSGELSVTFQANDQKFPQIQFVNLLKEQDTVTARFTIPTTHRTNNTRFTCQIQKSHSMKWKSNSIVNLFDDPSVKLSVISNEDNSTSMIQKLLCSATGLNPKIKWLPESVENNDREVTMNADGRMKVSSELSVPEEEWKRGTTFTCQVTDEGHSKTIQNRTSFCAVTPDHARSAQVYLLGPSISNMLGEDPVSVTCLLLGHRLQEFSVNCKVGTENLSSNVTKTENHSNGTESVQRVLRVPAQRWNKHENISCELKHPCSNVQTYTVFKIKDPKCPIIRIRGPSDDELSGSHNTDILCLIDGFLPADISVHWELNGTRLDTSLFTNSPAQFVSGSYSMHSALILSPLKREDGTFSCVVRHESSEKLIISNISNIYASINPNPPSVKLLQGQDKLICLVYGYSPSAINITWLHNNEAVQHNGTGSSAKGPDGKFIIKSHLNVKASEWEPGASYTCLVEHFTGQVIRSISKAEFIEKAIYFNDNESGINAVDQAEETWNMACAFVILFIISLIYGCSVTLVKVKTLQKV